MFRYRSQRLDYPKTMVTKEGNPASRSVVSGLRLYGPAAAFVAAALSLTLLLRGNSTGNTYYVSPTGNDSNPCTQTSPCATPDYAVNNKAAAGDRVQVAAGTYNYGSEVHFTKSGTAVNYITLTCATRGACKIQNSVTGNSTVVWIQGSYVTFDGFEVTNTSAGTNLGIYISGNHVSVTRNIVHHIEADCSSAGGGGINVAGGAGSGDVFDSNLVYDIGFANPGGCNGTNHVHGINFETDGPATVTITNNIVYHTLGGWGIQFQAASVGSTGSVIANNLLFSNGDGGIVFAEMGGTIDFNTVVNNIIVANGTDQAKCGIYEYATSGTHNVYMNNDAYGNAGGDNCFKTGSQTAGIGVNPSLGTTFVNWQADGSGDYHQKAGSPTINNGTSSTGAPKNDMDGNPRPQGAAYDIGAYESPN
jgi:hypothetical protein